MPRFYVDPSQIGTDTVLLSGGDYNHIKNVLRKQVGDTLLICDGEGIEYDCVIKEFRGEEAVLLIRERIDGSTELPVRVTLFQGLPKRDKLEFIIEKAVELGADGIVPVLCARSIEKPGDSAREEKKLRRNNAIAEAAAKQSGRGMIPSVSGILSFKKAITEAKEHFDIILFPYENADGVTESLSVMKEAVTKKKIAVFIGPEGGFAPEEVSAAVENGAKIISLGRRILRTETAGLTVLSYLMLTAESVNSEEKSTNS